MFKVLSIPIQDTTTNGVMKLIRSAIESKGQLHISTVNNEIILESKRNVEFRAVLKRSFCIPDSTGVVWAVRRLYKKRIERIPGADLFYDICKQAEQNGWTIFLLGGGRGIAHVARSKLMDRFPKLKIVGTIDGAKIHPSRGNLLHNTKIKKSGANIVMVALGAPKQELWIANNMKRTKSNVFIGIGGTLDFVSGNIRRAPLYMRRVGLEWLYRLIIEPSRIGRIWNALIVFPFCVIFKNQ